MDRKELRKILREMGYDYHWLPLSVPRFEIGYYNTKYGDEYSNRLASKLNPVRSVNSDEKIKLEKLGLRYFSEGDSWGFEDDLLLENSQKK